MKRSNVGSTERNNSDSVKVSRFCGNPPLTRSFLPRGARGKRPCIEPLTDLAAKVTAAHVPFELVEERCSRVPEPVLLKLITWSFPRSEADIRRYSAVDAIVRSLSEDKASEVHAGVGADDSSAKPYLDCYLSAQSNRDCKSAFKEGVQLLKRSAVTQAIQIGFHLSGIVTEEENRSNAYSSQSSTPATPTDYVTSFRVAVTFDRCKVTSSTCSCNSGNEIFFCRHVVAVLLFRMRHPHKVKIRAPISDSLEQLNRDQLQKLTQYLLARHSQILPTAQRIADLICDPSSTVNRLHGAPDPTAGASCKDEDRWILEEQLVIRYIRKTVAHTDKKFAIHCLRNILDKVWSMMMVRDKNGFRLLGLLTGGLLRGGEGLETSMHRGSYFNLWDDIGSMWICTILDPRIGEEKKSFLSQLRAWNETDPRTGGDDETRYSGSALSPTIREVFSRVIAAGSMDWSDEHLKRILRGEEEEDDRTPEWMKGKSHKKVAQKNHFNSKGQPLWWEATELACYRVEVLFNHSYLIEAVRLSFAVCRTIKEESRTWVKPVRQRHHSTAEVRTAPTDDNPLKPVVTLQDTFTRAYDAVCEDPLHPGFVRAQHEPEMYEVCLLKLGQQKSMPASSRSQDKLFQCEKKLITQLYSYNKFEDYLHTLKRTSAILLEGGRGSAFGEEVPHDSVPTHSFASYIVANLLKCDKDLAFEIGLRSLRIPILDSAENPNQIPIHSVQFYDMDNLGGRPYFQPPSQDVDRPTDPHVLDFAPSTSHYSMYPEHFRPSIDHLESSQSDLAMELISAAKGDESLLKSIVESLQRHMRNSMYVYRLSRKVFSVSSKLTPDFSLLNVSMHLAMQALRMTLLRENTRRKEMVKWLVTCATEIGLCTLHVIIKDWSKYFTPSEACTVVAGCVISPNTAMRLNLDPTQREDLYCTVCKMTVQCSRKDPQSCSLCSMTLSEKCPSAFDEVYHIVIEAADKRYIDSPQLYNIARYLDQKGVHARAFAVAYKATSMLRVPYDHDAYPAASDLLWTTQLALSLGLRELEELIMVIVSKVKCPSALSNILRTCTTTVSGRMGGFIGPYPSRGLRADRPPLRHLLEATIAAYISTIHSKLSHISPRHYNEFINFLNKARETFLLAPDGHFQFSRLLTNLKTIYKGKKKLLNLVALRFG